MAPDGVSRICRLERLTQNTESVSLELCFFQRSKNRQTQNLSHDFRNVVRIYFQPEIGASV
jgi:hypothetical protein